jgi:hypothetical protein
MVVQATHTDTPTGATQVSMASATGIVAGMEVKGLDNWTGGASGSTNSSNSGRRDTWLIACVFSR